MPESPAPLPRGLSRMRRCPVHMCTLGRRWCEFFCSRHRSLRDFRLWVHILSSKSFGLTESRTILRVRKEEGTGRIDGRVWRLFSGSGLLIPLWKEVVFSLVGAGFEMQGLADAYCGRNGGRSKSLSEWSMSTCTPLCEWIRHGASRLVYLCHLVEDCRPS